MPERGRRRCGIFAGAWLASAGCAQAADLVVVPPISGSYRETWAVVKHVDLDPGPGVRTVTAVPYAEDGHSGTDFVIHGLPAMVEGVDVLAPAAGRVLRVVDGQWDQCSDHPEWPEGRNCGNGVVLDHGGGWESQLCHLRKGSVSAKVGARVEAGEALGSVGWSGEAAMPHVHLVLRKDGQVVDPYLGTDPADPRPLWADPAAVPMAAPILWAWGFFDRGPGLGDLLERPSGAPVLSATGDGVVVGVAAFAGSPDTVLEVALTSPTGRVFRESKPVKRAYTALFVGQGRRMGHALPTGTWRASAALRVGTETEALVELSAEVALGTPAFPEPTLWEGCRPASPPS